MIKIHIAMSCNIGGTTFTLRFNTNRNVNFDHKGKPTGGSIGVQSSGKSGSSNVTTHGDVYFDKNGKPTGGGIGISVSF